MISVNLYGGLEQWFGECVELDAKTPAEVFHALASQCEEFYNHIKGSNADSYGYEIIVDDREVGEEWLELPVLTSISIVPVVCGAGDIGRAVLGAVLLVGSFFMPATLLGVSSFTVGAAGASLLIGGVIGMLTPKPTEPGKGSSLLDASGLPRSYQGDVIPLLFGLDWWILDPPIVGSWVSNNEVPVDWVPA
jgi:predicted phage tail protein